MNIFDLACFGIIPEIGDHKPSEQNEDGWTVVMILAYNCVEVQREWYHDPLIQNIFKMTVAVI